MCLSVFYTIEKNPNRSYLENISLRIFADVPFGPPSPPENISQSKVISWVDQKAASKRNGLRKYRKIPMP